MTTKRIPRSLWGWAFYDFANSAYVLIFQSFLLPVFFSTILITKGYSLGAWGFANTISTVIGVIISIFIGKYSDTHSRFKIFRLSIFLSFLGMFVLSLSASVHPESIYYLYIITNSIFIVSLSLSDSILPFIATKEESYQHSGFAWGFGYLGGALCLIIVVLLQHFTSDYSTIVFLSVALFYLLFSLYCLHILKNVELNETAVVQKQTSIISKKDKTLLFVGYWLISECITVIILFFSIFASQELHLSTLQIGISLLLVQLLAFPATWFGGKLTKKYNNLSLLGLTVLIWGAIIFLIILKSNIITLGIVIVLASLALGNSQSLIRAQYATLIDKSESGFQFGLYSFVSEAAVFIGPIIYGVASDYLKSQKIPILILFLLMVIGYAFVWKVIRKLT